MELLLRKEKVTGLFNILKILSKIKVLIILIVAMIQ